ncbi:DEAD/DEAH box helicase [Alkaliphilus peptidifermentans]|uniref:ATP-dependent RNA helicase CshA n=1 Tax=Alkaliphilus peptidifermentans DSM 18978 TaxID=1120976 RepID=A0A1G5HLI0_9FIRM|nr:DEAD/DEAH box helicase [Alkaliphilus peptidifermentans]SCY64762.1 ATP-dependent RNA helicase DeaD [Alkaliphilus peptidifermentans DSM 18978]
MNQFENLKVSKEILRVIEELGFETPTSIQEQAIPLIFAGHDLIGQAQTGTGKTAAFGIPMIEKVINEDKAVQILVLTPTRELAIQVADELQKFAKYKRGLKSLAIYGGQPIERQIKALKQGVQIVVGTPGRILDHIRRKTLKLSNITGLVMDEADQMLDMGFQEDIEAILLEMPNEKQTLMFSATIPKEIEVIAHKYMNSPKKVKVVHKELTVPQIAQYYFEVKSHEKLESLTRILDIERVALGMIFCNTKKGVDELVEKLQSRGYSVEGIHGDLKQSQRDRVMKKFRDGTIDMLIATDVAARGIDVDDVALVVNYDLPENFEYYVHRIGRTGRAGKLGLAYTLVTPRQISTLKMLERYIKSKLVRRKVPSVNDIVEKQKQHIADGISAIIEKGGLSENINFIEKLAETYNSIEIGAALLKMIIKQEEAELNEAKETHINTGAEKGMVRLYFNIGKRHGINAGNLLGAIANEAGIDGSDVGAINMYDKFSFVEVPRELERNVIKAMKKNRIKGRKISVEVAKIRE